MIPNSVKIVEVGPRDGLQNETQTIDVATKVDLIRHLATAGLSTIEAGALVSPKWVPQMADSAEVLQQVVADTTRSYPVLVPNDQGLDAAIAAGATEIAVFGAASETFSQKNINCSINDSLTKFATVINKAHDANIKVRGYVSCVMGCPYEGDVPIEQVAAVAKQLYELGCYEVSLGDTIGVGTPLTAQRMLSAVANVIPINHIAVHFHDTYGQALANIFACLQFGVTTIDSSVGGLGGCPYAPGAAGNVATEDVVYLLNGLGIEHGVDLDKLIVASKFIFDKLGYSPRSRVAQALIAKDDV